ncbi:SIS domain-containing protein [Paenibacillus chibensis]|uniref:SIS domain-containing protein n=1 Tax=Paenibacillus chibensis TaxID=59846 RepID=A0ABU6PMS8_9BACL|nr:SIS domain-containing protein [Paenibacillus chibensis]
MLQIERYFQAVTDNLDQVLHGQRRVMQQTSHVLADTVEQGGSIYITGCSHSSLFAQEVFYRAGGFILMNPIFLPGMTLETFPSTRTTKFERISGLAEAVLSETPLKKGDVLIIASISGRNTVPIELALWAKSQEVKVIALTSMTYSADVVSRHSSGKRLFELADLILDVMGEKGDAALSIDGLQVKTAPLSTVTGITMMHAVISQTIELLIQRGLTPPVFLSANLEGGDEHNKKLLEEYRHQIHYQ